MRRVRRGVRHTEAARAKMRAAHLKRYAELGHWKADDDALEVQREIDALHAEQLADFIKVLDARQKAEFLKNPPRKDKAPDNPPRKDKAPDKGKAG
jgi:hypothetical protein